MQGNGEPMHSLSHSIQLLNTIKLYSGTNTISHFSNEYINISRCSLVCGKTHQHQNNVICFNNLKVVVKDLQVSILTSQLAQKRLARINLTAQKIL